MTQYREQFGFQRGDETLIVPERPRPPYFNVPVPKSNIDLMQALAVVSVLAASAGAVHAEDDTRQGDLPRNPRTNC